jgi:hypothetical protein
MRAPSAIYKGTEISIKLGLNFDQATTDSAMTHILVLSVNVRRNKRIERAVIIDYRHW